MNYIKSIQARIEVLIKQNKAYEDGIKRIERYMSLPKFYSPENNVNINDIRLRFDEIKQEVNSIN